MKTNFLFLDLDKTLLTKDSSLLFIKKHYNMSILYNSVLRKLRFHTKKYFYSQLTLQCKQILSSEKLDIFVKDLKAFLNKEIFEFAKSKKSEGYQVVVVTSSPNYYVEPLVNSIGFENISSHYDDNGNFIFLHDIEKYNQISFRYPASDYNYDIGISDNDSDLIISQYFKNWIKYEPNSMDFNLSNSLSKLTGEKR